ncbi:MAG: ferredoxin [Gammaproteobacteria bacterium]|nr:MAG: ferredoxin [Gammaproteobacteria bacterium]
MSQDAFASLYAAHEKIYPREIHGRFQSLRTAAVYLLLGLYYALPWLQWGDRQAVLFDLPARRFYVFGLIFWPEDFFYLAWLLVLAALTLFLSTALAGRLWCGYACPQTVWTEVYLWMERWVEGDRNARIKLDRAPRTWRKILRKGLKQALWIGFALWTGFTFVGYFTPIRDIGAHLLAGELGPWAVFWWLFYALATYGNAGYLREQVCKYMCPYARFQSAMFDEDTLIIAYDTRRGEPRGKRKKGVDPRAAGLGDCVDCSRCVQVCPTGIDIRDGLQYECIACGACIDACNDVMDKIGYPRGLIRYTTERRDREGRLRILRPRIAIYALLWAALAGGLLAALWGRPDLAAALIHDRNTLYRMVGADRIENGYRLDLLNKTDAPRRLTLRLEGGPPGLALDGPRSFLLGPAERVSVALRLVAPRDAVRAPSSTVVFSFEEDGREVARREVRFLGPVSSGR